MDDDVLFFVELPDESIWFKVPKVYPIKRHRPCDVSSQVTNMVYDAPLKANDSPEQEPE